MTVATNIHEPNAIASFAAAVLRAAAKVSAARDFATPRPA